MTPNTITLYMDEDPASGQLTVRSAGRENRHHPIHLPHHVEPVEVTRHESYALTHDALDAITGAVQRYRTQIDPRPQPGPLDDLGETT